MALSNETAKALNPYVRERPLQDALSAYVEERLEDLYATLETARDMHLVGQAQGAIYEVKRLLTIANEVEEKLKREKYEREQRNAWAGFE